MQNKLKGNEKLEDLMCNNYHIIQDPTEYCFTSDATKLGNFVKAKKTDNVVDLCSGSGIVGIIIYLNHKPKSTTFVELQNHLADMCLRTIELNSFENMKVINKPLQNIHKEIGSTFDIVVCNPPYFKKESTSIINEKETIAICKHQITVTIEEIVEEASKLLKFGGSFYIVNKESEMADLICTLRKYNLETKEIVVNTNNNKGNGTVFIKATKGGKSGVKVKFNAL